MITDQGPNFMTLQVGSSAEASVAISIHDPTIPTFSVTSPKLCSGRKGGSKVVEDTSTGILSAGVVWTVRKVFRFGFVPPEGYQKDHRSNTAKAEQDGGGNSAALRASP